MRLFLRDHILFIVLQLMQCMMIPALFWLDGYRGIGVMIYAPFLSLVLLTAFLVYRYISRKRFYERLQHPIETMEESLETTERTPIAEALDQMLMKQYRLYQVELQKAEDRQDEHLLFIDRWVHQMKTPLSVIELTAQTLDEPESSSMREETDRMRNGLNTVLYMARLRTIVEDFQIKPVLLSKLIHEVNQENKRFYIRNEVYPQLKEQRPGITVETDEKWLFFLVTQLVHNAVKYSSGKAKHLHLSVYEREGEAVLEVRDFGIGIPTVDKKRVFNKFFTGENGRNYRESTGMGLYLVKEVAGKLEHRIELESEVGEGTTIRIIFSPTQNLTSM
ncbi:sensor histidine kinase [Aquibacillus koreensis]|uniref:histidine kinase n=1 Tax=Aquibacillus koreensis TaxID=279446 RepID=A0A9X3WSF1_9BACI|nr:sensor histidine kinase [Aquibacillus koreensis]MCT2535329.1 sensor histidine kinase [Aquibacillus koreensis]MDC3422494.1 sensor histidine kinase [Aquibacillus koreensis]